MRAQAHTQSMLRWWWRVGITIADMAIRRRDGTMVWHYETPLTELPLAWARAENARQAEIYIRPARVHRWPIALLDDLSVATATRIARKYDALVVHTSPQGGCHLWLLCGESLDEHERCRAQRWLAQRVEADQGSISGEHLGRLAGFKNWKRDGVWVNFLDATHRDRPWTPQLVTIDRHEPRLPSCAHRFASGGTDSSASGREWGWVCGLLEAGCDPAVVYHRLVETARPRRGRDAERYARRTVARARERVGLSTTTRKPREKGLTSWPS
jgi:hypothetical protein